MSHVKKVVKVDIDSSDFSLNELFRGIWGSNTIYSMVRDRGVLAYLIHPNDFVRNNEPIQLESVEELAGIAMSVKKETQTAEVLYQALVTSDDSLFYLIADQIANSVLNKAGVSPENVNKFLYIIHKDLSATLYINNIPLVAKVRTRIKNISVGDPVMSKDIYDVLECNIPGIEIKDNDRVIFCSRINWKYGIYFSLNKNKKFDNKEFSLILGRMYRLLMFDYVYNVLYSRKESEVHELIQKGWFPFIQLIPQKYQDLYRACEFKDTVESVVEVIINSFDIEGEIDNIVRNWWNIPALKQKRKQLEEAVECYKEGKYISCIKNLSSELEGILRLVLHKEEDIGKRIKFIDVLDRLLELVIDKGYVESNLLPVEFIKYLRDNMYKSFDFQGQELDELSRHTTAHGLASSELYDKEKALQLILTIDQVRFYLE